MNTDAKTQLINQPQEDLGPSSFRLISTLGLAGFFSGIVLVTVYLVTAPIIEANRAEALKRAIFNVLPGCHSYQALNLREGRLVAVEESNGGTTKSNKDSSGPIFSGFNEAGELIGFAIPASEPGFQDLIGAIFGYDVSGKVIIGFEVLESKETPGLGDKIIKDDRFQANFVSLKVDPDIKAVKSGKKEHDNEVETITGATISSRAVVRLLQKGIEQWRPAIEDYIESEELQTQR